MSWFFDTQQEQLQSKNSALGFDKKVHTHLDLTSLASTLCCLKHKKEYQKRSFVPFANAACICKCHEEEYQMSETHVNVSNCLVLAKI